MPVIEHSVSINRSVTDVFRFVADFSNNTKWQPGSMRLERTGKVKVGEMVVGTQRLMGRMVHVNADVVDYDPNQRITYTGIIGGYPFKTTYDFKFAGTGTKVTYKIDIRVMWWYFMFRPLIVNSLSGQMKETLAGLKEAMESRRDLGT